MTVSATMTIPPPPNPVRQGLLRGLLMRCPHCGQGSIFRRYLKVKDNCGQCGLALGEFRADDAPPYFTIMIVGHIIVPAMLLLEQLHHPATWIHTALWVPLTVGLSLALLPRMKGAVIGVQWALKIKG
jgi:uncharacterized protein (DUF983 family)